MTWRLATTPPSPALATASIALGQRDVAVRCLSEAVEEFAAMRSTHLADRAEELRLGLGRSR